MARDFCNNRTLFYIKIPCKRISINLPPISLLQIYIYLIQIFSLAKKPDQFPDARSREKVCFSDHRQDNQALLGKKNSSCVKRLTSGVDHPLADRPRRGKGAKKATASTSNEKRKGGGARFASPPISDYYQVSAYPFVSFNHEPLFPPTRTRRAYLPPRAWKP